MSAYIVDREHIKYLVSAAAAGREGRMSYYHNGKSTELRRDDQDSLTKAGQMLWDANIESIQALYPDCRDNMNNAPGPVGETFIYAHGGGFKDGRDGFEAAQVFKAANCYEYQSCEADTWKDSEAKAFIDALTAKYIRMLPGYEAAEWGAPKPVVRKPVTFAAPVKKNVATPGFADLAAKTPAANKWAAQALTLINPGALPDMVIGSAEAKAARFEDEGRTLVLPVPANTPKLYACTNETGGVTFMLASEY